LEALSNGLTSLVEWSALTLTYAGQQVLLQGLKLMGPSFQESEDFF